MYLSCLLAFNTSSTCLYHKDLAAAFPSTRYDCLNKDCFCSRFFFVMLLWDADSHFSKLYFEYICAWSNDHTEKDDTLMKLIILILMKMMMKKSCIDNQRGITSQEATYFH